MFKKEGGHNLQIIRRPDFFSNSKVFLSSLIAFIAGIAIASFAPIKILIHDLAWLVAVASVALIVIVFMQKPRIRIPALLILFFILGIWRYSFGLSKNTPDKIWHYNGKTKVIFGRIINEPERKANYQRLEFKTDAIKNFDAKVDGSILITTSLYPVYYYGEKIEIKCRLEKPEKFKNFSYDRYLARFDIFSLCYYPQITRVGKSGNIFFTIIYAIKDAVRRKIETGLTEPEASLAMGILLGDTKGTSEDIKDAFSKTGLSHITAVSGMNISIIAALLIPSLLFAGFWRRQAFFITVFFLIFFVILVGMPASAIRAGIMGFLVLLSFNIGRTSRILNSVIFTAALLLFFNPKLLRDDIGFQLSFLAVFGIIYFYHLINTFLEKIRMPSYFGLRDILSITLSAQVLTLPIIAYNFSVISLSAPLSNILVLWSITFLTIALFLAVTAGLFFPNWAVFFFLPVEFLLKYIIFIAKTFSNLPYSFIKLEYFPLSWLIFYYLAIYFILLYKIKKDSSFSFNSKSDIIKI